MIMANNRHGNGALHTAQSLDSGFTVNETVMRRLT